ncbi:hypothetical protein [Yinghuangia sp. YIM S09857]|uniref:hypothetical protein n=1 Tax=Yinghuangia sp. YIM S09857 TaxID=3436929 RepID=UPI003F535FB0
MCLTTAVGCAVAAKDAANGRAGASATASSTTRAHVDQHTGDTAVPGMWVRSPSDRWALEVQAKDSREDPHQDYVRFRIRVYVKSPGQQGKLGNVVYTDDRWYRSASAWSTHFRWDEATDTVYVIVRSSPYSGGRSEIRQTQFENGDWHARTIPPEADSSLPNWLKYGYATLDNRPGWRERREAGPDSGGTQ